MFPRRIPFHQSDNIQELIAAQLSMTGWDLITFDMLRNGEINAIDHGAIYDHSSPDADFSLYLENELVGVVKVHQIGEAFGGMEQRVRANNYPKTWSKIPFHSTFTVFSVVAGPAVFEGRFT